MDSRVKICKACLAEKSLDLFYDHWTNLDGKQGICIECRKKRMAKWRGENRDGIAELSKVNNAKPEHRRQAREWQIQNPDKVAQHNRNSRAKHPETMKASKHRRRAIIEGLGSGDVTKEFLRDLYDQWTGECPCCRRTECDPSLDHKTPISRGGTHMQDNLWLICLSCNSRKRALTVDEFFNLLRLGDK